MGAYPSNPEDLTTFAGIVGRLFRAVERGIPRGPRTIALSRATTLPDGIQTEHALYRCDASGAAFTVTLPRSIASADTVFTLKRLNAGPNAVTWLCQGTDTVDGAATGTLATQYAVLRLYCRTGGFDVL